MTSDRSRPAPVQAEDDPAAARAAVARTLAGVSTAWQHRRYDELAVAFDERIVMALPGFSGRVEGRDALVASYREFMERATLTHYAEAPPTIDVWGHTAVATYRWEMRWLRRQRPEPGGRVRDVHLRTPPRGGVAGRVAHDGIRLTCGVSSAHPRSNWALPLTKSLWNAASPHFVSLCSRRNAGVRRST